MFKQNIIYRFLTIFYIDFRFIKHLSKLNCFALRKYFFKMILYAFKLICNTPYPEYSEFVIFNCLQRVSLYLVEVIKP